jgi:hypothetical protein
MSSSVLSLVLAARRVDRATPNGGRIDVGGQVTAAVAIGGLTFAIIEALRMGWAEPAVLVAVAGALFGSVTFVVCEHRATNPMLPPALARRPLFTRAALIGALFQFGFSGQVFVLSLFFQQGRGESTLKAGLSFLPMTVLVAVSDLLAPRIVRRIGSLRTLPLHERMRIQITALEPHPNDPDSGGHGHERRGPDISDGLPEPRLTRVYRLDAALGEPLDLGRITQGRRRIVPLTGGTLSGPELNGDLIGGTSADWQIVLPDGTAPGDIRYTLKTDGGALLYVHPNSAG